jgi:transcriptional regulator with XRE-family HTH domain
LAAQLIYALALAKYGANGAPVALQIGAWNVATERSRKEQAKGKKISEREPPSGMKDAQEVSPLAQRIGDVIRHHRIAHKLTLTQLAKGAEMSAAVISRIENGYATSSFESVERLCTAVGITLGDLFAEVSAPHDSKAQLVRKNEQMEVVRKGTRHGHVYRLLSYDKGPSKAFESFYITMDKDSDTYPRFRHPGTEFIYMLRGSMDYRHGEEIYRINPGDSLTFSGQVVHGPEKLYSEDIHLLCVIIYSA